MPKRNGIWHGYVELGRAQGEFRRHGSSSPPKPIPMLHRVRLIRIRQADWGWLMWAEQCRYLVAA